MDDRYSPYLLSTLFLLALKENFRSLEKAFMKLNKENRWLRDKENFDL